MSPIRYKFNEQRRVCCLRHWCSWTNRLLIHPTTSQRNMLPWNPALASPAWHSHSTQHSQGSRAWARGLQLPACKISSITITQVSYGDKPEEQFKDADVIVFLGGFPRKPGMERKDLLQINKKIFMEQAKALSMAKTDVRCVVVANPANTNAYILSHFAPSVKKENITCLSRLDHNRAIGQIISKTGCQQK